MLTFYSEEDLSFLTHSFIHMQLSLTSMGEGCFQDPLGILKFLDSVFLV